MIILIVNVLKYIRLWNLMEEESSVSLAASGLLSKTIVPVCAEVKWYQRRMHVFVSIEAPSVNSPEVTIDDSGLVAVSATIDGEQTSITLELFDRIDSARCRLSIYHITC